MYRKHNDSLDDSLSWRIVCSHYTVCSLLSQFISRQSMARTDLTNDLQSARKLKSEAMTERDFQAVGCANYDSVPQIN